MNQNSQQIYGICVQEIVDTLQVYKRKSNTKHKSERMLTENYSYKNKNFKLNK